MTFGAILRDLGRRRLDTEGVHTTVPVADVLGTLLMHKAVRALQKAAA